MKPRRWSPEDEDDYLDYEESPKKRRPKYYCKDRTCGALDCRSCYPDDPDIKEEN